MRRAFAAVAALVLVAVAGLGGAWLYMENYEPDRTLFPVRGIDVSHHQGPIDWSRVAADDVAFAFIKASEGGDHRDRRFRANWAEAQAAGLKVGAYHFFTFCRPGADQARNFIEALGGNPGSLPAALDLEFGGNCAARPEPAAMLKEIEAFVTMVERQTGRPLVLYVTSEFWDAYGTVLPKRPLWVRSIFWRPSREDWTFWQYHNGARVDGIDGPVDLNVFRGSLPDLQELGRAERPLS